MDLLSLSTSPLYATSLSSHPSLGRKTPNFSLRHFSSLKCSLRSDQSSSTPETLIGSDVLRFEYKEPQSSQPISANQAPGMARRGGDGGDPFGLLLRERIVFLGHEIEDFVADAIISQLLLLDAQDPTKDIRLFINAPGGSLSAAMAIYDVMQLLRADVSTVALGISASTASLVLGGGTKGKRFAMPNTRMMIHQPVGRISGQATSVETQAEELLKNKQNVTKIISSFSGRSYEQVLKDIELDNFMSPIEAVEFGLIDGVIDRDSILHLEPIPKIKDRRFIDLQSKNGAHKLIFPDIPADEII